MFIGSIKGLNKHSTAREGNYMGASAFEVYHWSRRTAAAARMAPPFI